MFWHNFKYAGKMLIKGKDTLFWTILFPIALFTFMYMAFGNIMEKDEMFKDIPVAVVRDGKNDTALMMVLSTLSMDGEDKRIDMEVLNEKEALQKLNDEEVTGVIYTSDASLTVRQSDIKESILESILNQYKQMEQMYLNLMQKDPEHRRSFRRQCRAMRYIMKRFPQRTDVRMSIIIISMQCLL